MEDNYRDNVIEFALIYLDKTFNDLDAPERMHCFILFYVDDEVYQMEQVRRSYEKQ